MKVPVNSIRAGNVIEYNGKLWVAAKVQHISPGKGGAFVAIEAKALREGNKLQERFRSGETIEHVHIDERECTYLFKDDNGFTFMDKENYEQLTVGADVLDPDQSRWLQDGMEVTVSLYEGSPVGVELPKSVVLAVTEADAVVKGQTASSSYKPAVVEGGIRVMVPPHIAVGTRLVINTEDGSLHGTRQGLTSSWPRAPESTLLPASAAPRSVTGRERSVRPSAARWRRARPPSR